MQAVLKGILSVGAKITVRPWSAVIVQKAATEDRIACKQKLNTLTKEFL